MAQTHTQTLTEKVFGAGKDLYEMLGVARDASLAEIKKAYKRAALKCHPDKCPGDDGAAERFQALSAVHSILSDPSKREAYDQSGDIDDSDLSEDAQHWYVDVYTYMDGCIGVGMINELLTVLDDCHRC
jgi:DnaJ-class molecular chaperone